MKRTILSILVAVAALVGAIPAKAQVVQSEDGTITSYDNLILGKKEAPWQFEFSVRQVATLGWLPELVTVGMRKGNMVFGIGSGHGTMFFDAYPASISYIPVFAYNRFYLPLGSKGRFSLYTDQFLGYHTIYRVTGETQSINHKKGDGHFFISWQPGISIRLWGKSNLFLGPVIVSDPGWSGLPLFGAHLGLAL